MILLKIIIIIFVNLYLSLLLASLGNIILKHLKIKLNSSIEEVFFSIALGLVLVVYMVFALLALKIFYQRIVISILFSVSLLTYSAQKRLFKIISTMLFDIRKYFISSHRIVRLIFVFISIILLANLIISLMPPDHADVLSYHFVLPKVNIERHGFIKAIQPIFNHGWDYMEFLYSLCFILLGENMAKNMAFLISVFSLSGIWLIARLLLDKKMSIFTVLLFITLSENIFLIATGKNDFAMLLFSICAIYSFTKWYSKENIKWLILSAIFLGFALGVKLFAATLIIVSNLLLLVKQRLSAKERFRILLIYDTIILAVLSPILIKNAILWSNPFHPYLYNLLPINTEIAREIINYTPQIYSMCSGLGTNMTLGFANLFTFRFWLIPDYNLQPSFWYILLAFTPLGLFIKLRKKGLFLLFLILILTTLNALLFRALCYRYFLIVILLLMIFISYIIGEIIKEGRPLINMLVKLSLFLIVVASLWNYRFIIYKNPLVAYIHSKRRAIDNGGIKYIEIIRWINENIPYGTKVLFANGTGQLSYYIRTDLLTQNIFLDKLLSQHSLVDIYNNLKEQEIKYIVFFPSLKIADCFPERAILDSIMISDTEQKKRFRTILISEDGIVYGLL